MADLEVQRTKQTEVMAELKQCLYHMVFWPEGHQTPNPETDKAENPKLTWSGGPGYPFRNFSLCMRRLDLGESRAFFFKLRSTRTLPEDKAPKHWKCTTPDWSTKQRVSVEPPDVHVRFSKFIIELIKIEGGKVVPSDIPHDAVVAVTKKYIEDSNR